MTSFQEAELCFYNIDKELIYLIECLSKNDDRISSAVTIKYLDVNNKIQDLKQLVLLELSHDEIVK